MEALIIDAHHHLWRWSQVPWLNGPMQARIFGAYEGLRRDYLGPDFQADVQAHGVRQSVYVQVNVAPGDEVQETARIQAIAAESGFPQAIVAFADLADPALPQVLDQHAASGHLRGIRQQLHWHSKPQYRYASRPDLMADAAWRAGLRQLQQRGLSFDLQVFPGQMADAGTLATDFPDQRFVLLHAGMLEDRSTPGWAQWRQGMRALAACPNVSVKLSGLGTFERSCSVALWQPVVRETVDIFSPARCMFGSNFPIESLWTSYAQLIDTMRQCLAELSATERQQVWHDHAAEFYRLAPSAGAGGPAAAQ